MTKFFTIFLISAILLIDLHCKVEASANTTTTPTLTTKTPTPTTKTTTPTTKTTTPTTTPKTPTTTTKTKTSTKMTPTTAAPPKVPRYVVKDNANKTCIILEGKISIRVQYMMTNNKTNLTEPFSPPENTNVTGACNNTTAEMKLEFKGQELSFYFTDKNKSMTMDHVQMKINPVGAYFPNAKNGTLQFNGTGLSEKVPDNTYYYCSIHDVILFSNTNTTVNMSIEELQAFNIDKDNVTGKGYLCERGREKPIPQPPSSPPQNKFSLKKDGKYCFFMQSSFQISVTYENNQTKNVTKLLSVPSFNSTGHSITGSCNTTWYSEKAQVLNFSFFNNRWSIEMTFSESALKSSSMLTADNSKYSLSEVKIKAYLDDTLFPDIMKSEPMEADVNVTMFEGNKEGAFQCKSNQTIVNGKLALYSSNLKYQAFTNSNTTKFAKDVTQCSADMETNSTVPIAVGAALAGLVVIVLIAYLIGRRRSRKSGYESV